MEQLPLLGEACQRWLGGHARYRRPAETIRTQEYDVAEIADDTTAKGFVVEHHYSRSYPAARFRFGLYRRGALVGVAVFSHPVNERALAVFGSASGVELGRFVLLDAVPGNGETWFLARTFEQLRHHGIAGVLSFSDPVPRRTVDGSLVLPGHVGRIYQAHNGVYLGRSTPRRLRLLPDGRVLSDRAIAKIRARDRGWRYAAAQLEAFGARALQPDDDPTTWLRLWLPRLTQPLRHRGNHRYVWALDRAVRRRLPAGLAYPKHVDPPG
jgi:hypothetical protein